MASAAAVAIAVTAVIKFDYPSSCGFDFCIFYPLLRIIHAYVFMYEHIESLTELTLLLFLVGDD